MKRARPDLFHPRIVLAGPGDDAGLIAALRRRGLHARWRSWQDPATVHADLVILRAATDYRGRLRDFLAWTKRVPNLLNAPDVLAWNVDRQYLRDLRRAGVPTAYVPVPGDQTALVFLGGEQSHAFADKSAVEVDDELWDVGRAALQAAADRVGVRAVEMLYARADVTGTRSGARLVSLDLVAPSLGWRSLTDTARANGQRRFAVCVSAALQRLGLGPFAHRRP
ncbi:hypothetical protein [Mycobacterium botniense]|uniref:ATP-grasp domain-containing protein n=1 Tax=Mycobacterium botniense TaxID=84962 RepID=A0A7I9Y1Y2_9MYCO|nr:hypothetical protein [Mycobacterium botniense]GFG76085.1 hypothetical protein MBOT_34500 [Mycobacterium botniense]